MNKEEKEQTIDILRETIDVSTYIEDESVYYYTYIWDNKKKKWIKSKI
jgi:hypothetical protein